MARLGYKPGSALGKDTSTDSTSLGNGWPPRLTEPIGFTIKEDRGGIGLEAEKKRKFKEEAEIKTKRTKTQEGEFRERIKAERDEQRREAQFIAAQKVLEKVENEPSSEVFSLQKTSDMEVGSSILPTSSINILYRGLVRSRERKAFEAQAAKNRFSPFSSIHAKNNDRLPHLNDYELEGDDKLALGMTPERELCGLEFDGQSDEELEEFNALSSQERLKQVVRYLREKYNYCFWCKCRYEALEMNGCPGLTEEDHD